LTDRTIPARYECEASILADHVYLTFNGLTATEPNSFDVYQVTIDSVDGEPFIRMTTGAFVPTVYLMLVR